jgi:hypothetical protein
MVWRVQYHVGTPEVDYPGPIVWAPSRGPTDRGGSFCCACLHCRMALTPLIAVRAGDILLIVVGESDSKMFCSGNCRRDYFLTKSSIAIRRTVQEVDGSQCSRCGVDCERLVADLAALGTIQERKRLLEVCHPAFLADAPVHAARLLRTPTAGNCWHADHIVPVWQGGGMADLTNLQTLCVPCHLVKSRLEACLRAGTVVEDSGTAPLPVTLAATQCERRLPFGSGAPRRRLAM